MQTSKYALLGLTFLILAFLTTGCGQKAQNQTQGSISTLEQNTPQFYSSIGKEVVAKFKAQFRTRYTQEEFAKITTFDKRSIEQYEIPSTYAFLFGPLTERSMGGSKRDQKITVNWSSAKTGDDGLIEVTYSYKGTWLIEKETETSFELPLPYNTYVVMTDKWKNCTDSAPDHQTESFFWYFWDPTRYGCDHQLGKQYQNITVKISDETTPTYETYPEYQKLLQSAGIKNNLQMTFAFGYVEDVANPNPEKDMDFGMGQFQTFLRSVRSMKTELKLKETPILEREYQNDTQSVPRPDQKIGVRFIGKKDGVTITINVVAAADVDQMVLFAKSFAHDHDGFFGWFGHSRVGSGFDANNFGSMVRRDASYYSISPNYQMIYWAGCNSYSYYSLPFFSFKSALNPTDDPNGTKNLDILGNGLPSLFAFNAYNAKVTLDAMVNWQNPTSYQKIVDQLENHAAQWGTKVLVNILGDEDNESM